MDIMAKHISVTGIVQGVGFRPFVYGLATQLNLRGWVCNTSGGVEIHVDGSLANVDRFIQRLELEKPALARIDSLQVRTEDVSGDFKTFDILPSVDRQDLFHPIPADIGICPECERDLFDPRNRRYLYPFINCAHCGPRFTIIKNIPYDRTNTTMAEFGMCAQCSAEYGNPLDRHFHAQPIACPDCGPFVALREIHTQFDQARLKITSIDCRTSAILKARRLLREGYILGVKGLGGFHLVCDASNTLTVEELRDRKGKIGKPFALMAANIDAVRAICTTSKEAEELLRGREKPIVVLEKNSQFEHDYSVSRWVAPSLDTLGVMLPYTPLHHLLLNQTDPVLATEPVPPLLVMTSGNVSDEPIATSDEDALLRLSSLVDAFLLHNREIHMRCDDSVVRVDGGQPATDHGTDGIAHRPSSIVYLRRSRGYAPYPVKLPFDVQPTLAIGAEWNNAFCLARDRSAFLSHYIGNMENVETYESFEKGVRHLAHVFRVQPEIVAHDQYPNFFSTQYARRSTLNARRVTVQHHHAHIASCMADNGLDNRRLIGLAFDGTGYGTDGAIWGGEALLASYSDFERLAHLEYLPLPGGDTAYRAPWSVACGYAHALGLVMHDLPFLRNIDPSLLRALWQQLDESVNAPLTSSMGRLFDAVASLIGVRNDTTYEAQAAIEMEVLARPFISSVTAYPYTIEMRTNETIIGVKDLLATVISDVRLQKSSEMIAARFHRTVAEMAIELCRQARQSTGLDEVALSGGVWQNRILLDLVRSGLKQEGFVVYFHRQVPTNDGGLALGQAVIANHSK
jgi:hydrogenase maturation protein HypF